MAIGITKEGAALRLITAAIEMEKSGAEPLAILVVAASALNMIREMLRKRGASFEDRVLRMLIWGVAYAGLDGGPFGDGLANAFPDLITDVRNQMQSGEIHDYMDIEISTSKDWSRSFLASVYRPYNFLKHADRDLDQYIESHEVDVGDAVMLAVTAYSMLFHNQIPPEPLASFGKRYNELNPDWCNISAT